MLFYNKFLNEPIIPQNATIVYGIGGNTWNMSNMNVTISSIIVIIVIVIIYMYAYGMLFSENYAGKPHNVGYDDYEDTYSPYGLGYSPKR